MKIIKIENLISKGHFSESEEYKDILYEVITAIRSICWPTNSDGFTLYPEKNANGVVPIKRSCMISLSKNGWNLEQRMKIVSSLKPGKIDAIKRLSDNKYFALEWETGNISSTHRALNKIAIGLIDGVLAGGILILPSREMYKWLTDRVGNYQEIEPYFPIWRNLPIKEGVLAIIVVEQDATCEDVPKITKGTDGRALR